MAMALMGEGQHKAMGLQLADKVTKEVLQSVDNDELHPFNEKFYTVLVNIFSRYDYNKPRALEFQRKLVLLKEKLVGKATIEVLEPLKVYFEMA